MGNVKQLSHTIQRRAETQLTQRDMSDQLVWDSKPHDMPRTVTSLTRNAHSLATSESVAEFWPVLSVSKRCNVPSSSDVIIFTLSRSTVDSKRDTITWPSICHQLSWMLNLATLSLLANADHFLRLSDSIDQAHKTTRTEEAIYQILNPGKLIE